MIWCRNAAIRVSIVRTAPVVAEGPVIRDLGECNGDAAECMPSLRRSTSPWVGHEFPTRAVFGDTRLRTTLSVDADRVGRILSPEDGQRFVRGEEAVSNTGQRIRLPRTMDSLGITDHPDDLVFAPDDFAGDTLSVPAH